MSLKEKYAERIEKIRAKYPDDAQGTRSTVMPLLYIAQEEYGSLNEDVLREVAELCNLDPTQVKTIAGFYTMYWEAEVRGHKKGQYWLQVCTDLPCALRGADKFYQELLDYLGIKDGETTEDGLVTAEHVMCLAACDKAPMLQCNFHYMENLTIEQMQAQIDEWRAESGGGKSAKAESDS